MEVRLKSLPYIPLRVTSAFTGYRINPVTGKEEKHLAVDLGANKSKYKGADGGAVLAVLDGIVANSYFNKYRGWVVIIKHEQSIKTISQHLLKQGLPVGTKVKAGQELGRMGSTGTSTATHLHFELIINGKAVDPVPFLNNIEKEDEDMAIIYKTFEDVPGDYKPSIEKLITLEVLMGDGKGNYNISEDMARIFTTLDRLGLLKS